MYYLRTRPAADAVQFTVDKTARPRGKEPDGTAGAPKARGDAEEGCLMCSS